MRGHAVMLLVLMLAGCATQPAKEQASSSFNLNQHRQMLTPESSGGAGEIQPYQLAATEGFRMPVAVSADDPVLPLEYAKRSLDATTVCVNVILDAQGRVERSAPLLAHSACGAGSDTANAGLLQAALAATSGWLFEPAAVCHYAAGVTAPSNGDCSNASRIEVVPVTLAYAFTFEVIEGRAMVRREDALH
ncbi:MAG: hypothetical protein DI584_11040 [Stenotrophomonas sp.]|nr:MAG: hypothetical protein DI584_11040 [Stenotrophomonas sp.]